MSSFDGALPRTPEKVAMRVGARAEVVSMLAQAKGELCAMARVADGEIGAVARAFEGLAGHADTILKLAAAIVGCVENESISSVLPKVQTLGAAARRFIEDRLQATAGILETVTREVKLLHQRSLVARGQEAIAFKIKTLSVLTNIEVAHLGTVGAGFQYLANELADFSKSASKDTRELASQTAGRRGALEDTRRVLSAELPRQRAELVRIEADLGNALVVVECSLTQLSRTPVQFKMCVEDIARQIAGVVAAIQAHDITRQQIEHVQEAFVLMAGRMRDAENPENGNTESGTDQELPRVYGGLTIQIYQAAHGQETVGSWTSQIRTCMGDIMRVIRIHYLGPIWVQLGPNTV